MVGEKKIEKPEPVAIGLKSESVAALGEQEVASGKDGVPANSTSSLSLLADATSSTKGETDHGSVGEHGVHHSPTSSYSYFYPGMFPHNGQMNYRPNGRVWNVNDRSKPKDKYNRNGEFEAPTELTRGPRAHNKSAPSDSTGEKIGLKQGSEMLSIFKSYTEKTSLLDDFNFYENRVKSLNSKSSKPATQQMEMYSNGNISNNSGGTKISTDPSSLINLTKNLSLNASPLKSTSVKNPPIANSIPSVSATSAF
ncbi:hypothetical protein FH972_004486 [Carpinus fangiana]|uniref:YTH domain-containing family protein n=1 Tax=Carpinus fangiana TaxID=176857 RepID=A0A5N6QLA0_9ROSI|nr:hypothetical protein FH972_004486 [Carpinus fangiana]